VEVVDVDRYDLEAGGVRKVVSSGGGEAVLAEDELQAGAGVSASRGGGGGG